MSTRPPIPQGNPPSYAFVTRVYRRSLRPIVIMCALTSAVWTLLWAVSNFQDINSDKSKSLPQFVPFDIALGALFMAAFAIEAFGIFAATTQRLAFVRIYSILTLVATLFVFAAQVISIVLDFKYKNTLLDQCVTDNTNDTVVVHDGFGARTKFLTPDQAHDFCKGILNRSIFADFAWIIVSTILSLLFASIVFSYYRQLLDPSSMAYPRAPSDQVRMQTFGMYPAPAGAPPRAYNEDFVPPYDPHKLPGYDAQGRDTPEEKVGDDAKQPWGAEAQSRPQFAPPPGPPPQASAAANPFEHREDRV